MYLSIRLTVPCGVCGSHDGHESDCELKAIQELHKRNTYINCPKCHEGKVGLNKDDFYECRACRTQFTTNPGVVDTENPERVILLDYKNDRPIDVLVFQLKGRGEFPIDEAIVELRQRITEKFPEHDPDDEAPEDEDYDE